MADISMDFVEEEDMLLLFDTTPDKFPWRGEVAQAIERRRALMSDMLIFDTLLYQGGIRRPHTLYPPHDKESLRQLLNAIDESRYDTLKKDNLVYFLLKWHGDEKAQTFKEQKCMPPHFSALVDAYWLLDTGNDVPRAISILSDARLGREWPSKILEAISLTLNPYPLIRKFVRTVNPSLQEPNDLDMYVLALADGSLWEAWQYQSTYPEGNPIRARLIERILHWCLTPKPKSKPLTQLLAFPLTPYEQNLIQKYALEPSPEFPSNSLPALQNLVCVRLIQSGKYASAIKLDRQFSVKSGDAHRKAAQERRQMMDEILAVMPVIERMLLEQELEKSGHGSQVPASSNADSVTWTPPDLTMSWEYVRPPININSNISAGPSASARKTKTPRTSDVFMEPPIPQRSGAPRFGGPIPDEPEPVQSISASRGPSARGPSAKTPSKSVSAAGSGRLPPKASPSAQSGSASASASAVRSKISLFESVGSANMARNAFYEPPVSAGKKRAVGQDEARSPQGPSASASANVSFRTAPTDISSVSMDALNELMNEDDDDDDDDEQEVQKESTHEEEDVDIEMDVEAPRQEKQTPEVEEEVRAEAEVEEPEPENHSEREGLSFSLFASYSPSQNASASIKRPAQTTRQVPERATPNTSFPGSFDNETEPESPVTPTPAPPLTRQPKQPKQREQAARYAHPKPEVVVKSPISTSTRARTTRQSTPSAPSAIPQPTRPAVQTRASTRPRRVTRTGSETISQARTFPGAFENENDDDSDRKQPEARGVKAKQAQTTTTTDEDVVPPLPTVSTASQAGPRRTTRKSKISSKTADEEGAKARVTRRSSRISATGSESPEEPASPVKRRTRTATAATPKKSTRKQR